MSVHRYGKYKVTDKATGEVHYLTAAELAKIPRAPKIKPFKSARAARIAFGKAERAWETARGARINTEHSTRSGGVPLNFEQVLAPFKKAEAAAYRLMVAIYEQAKRQDIYIRSWELGNNPTRDLIRQNID